MKPKPKLYLISNMYPSKANVRFGVFVKNFVQQIADDWDVKKIVITKKYNVWSKLWAYVIFYSKIILLQFKVQKNDLIYVHFPLYAAPPLYLFCFRKNTIILNFHGNDLVIDRPLRKILAKFLPCLVKKSKIVTPSPYYAQKVSTMFDIDVNSIFVSPSGGINQKVFYPQKDKTGHPFTIAFVSALIYEKGWIFFIEAMHKIKKQNLIPDLKIIMVGDGVDKEKVLESIAGKKLPIDFYSGLTHPEIAKIYNQADVFIFPTILQGESLGLVGLEAMACGTPVIGSDWQALKTYLKDGYNGYLFAPTDVDDLVDKIMTYYHLPEAKKDQFKKAALETAKRFYSTHVKNQMIQFLQQQTN